MIYDLKLSSQIKKLEGSFSILEYLTKKFTYKSETEWLECINNGIVLLNGVKADPKSVVFENDIIEFVYYNFEEPDLDCAYKIEFENEHILVVSKPANLPVQSTRRIFRQTLTYLLRQDFGNQSLNPLHRLDRETSGLIVYQKKKFEKGALKANPIGIIKEKYYLAILKGHLKQEITEVNLPLEEAKDGIVNYKMVPVDFGKPCKSIFYRIKENKNETLALVKIFTGKKHQIRAHAAWLGCPIVGDKLYSENGKYFLLRCEDKLTDEDINLLGSKCHMLHAYALVLNFGDKEEKVITSKLLTKEMKDKIQELCEFSLIKQKLKSLTSAF